MSRGISTSPSTKTSPSFTIISCHTDKSSVWQMLSRIEAVVNIATITYALFPKYGVICQSYPAFNHNVLTQKGTSAELVEGMKDKRWSDIFKKFKDTPLEFPYAIWRIHRRSPRQIYYRIYRTADTSCRRHYLPSYLSIVPSFQTQCSYAKRDLR